MKIAIHAKQGSFSDRWIETCKAENIPFSLVDCLATDVIRQCSGMDAVLWHWGSLPEEQIAARPIIASLELCGVMVFPNTATCWHFDDKVAQKYLLEAIGAPMVPSYVFVKKKMALDWITKIEFPKVFKLRCGASSSNVQLVLTRDDAYRLIKEAFSAGFTAAAGYFEDYKTKLRNTKDLNNFLQKLKRAPHNIINTILLKKRLPRQRDYVYFQDFQANNTHDTRVTVIGDRAFAFRRMVRSGDFRASGSGNIDYNIEAIDKRCLRIAFDVAQKLGTQSLAFDFVNNDEKEPLIVEISYCYKPCAVYACPGHWDSKLDWHEGHMWPEVAILEDMLTIGGKFPDNSLSR